MNWDSRRMASAPKRKRMTSVMSRLIHSPDWPRANAGESNDARSPRETTANREPLNTSISSSPSLPLHLLPVQVAATFRAMPEVGGSAKDRNLDEPE